MFELLDLVSGTDPMQVYLREQYPNDGPLLSVVVGRTAHCEPRESGLLRHEYTHVEAAAIIEPDGLVNTEYFRQWLPDAILGDDDVVTLSVAELEAVRAGLREKYGEPTPAAKIPWPMVRE